MFLIFRLGNQHNNLSNYRLSPIMIGVGGTLDVLSGIKKHAPRWTRYGLEWIYYALQDPKKFKRYIIVNTYFIYKFVKYIIGGK